MRVTDPLLNPGSPDRDPPASLREIEAFVAEHLQHGVTGSVIPRRW